MRLGDYLIMRGRVSKTDVDQACQMQMVNNHMIGVLAVDHGLMTPGELEDVLRHQARTTPRERFGEVAMGLGYMDRSELEGLLEIQRENRLRIGDVLVLQSRLTEEELIAELHGYRDFLAAEQSETA
jgi:hypothetical protein